jgi:acetoin utilization protein AcuB
MDVKEELQDSSDASALLRMQACLSPISVGDIMTREIVTMSPQDTFREAIGLIANRPFRHFLVVHPDGRLAGVISDRDLLRILARKPDWQNTTVGEVMTTKAVAVRPETPLSAAIGEILSHRINCLPVLEEKVKVCGIVTTTDMLKAFQNLQASIEKLQEA